MPDPGHSPDAIEMASGPVPRNGYPATPHCRPRPGPRGNGAMARETAARTGSYTGVFPGRADQVGKARREMALYLAGCPVADDALIVLSELATNAVLHSRSGHDFFTVHAELSDHHARLTVEDAGGTWEEPAPASTDGGRGLQIVAALAEAWGIDGDTHGRVIWARFAW